MTENRDAAAIAEELLDAAAAQLGTPAARARLTILAARMRGDHVARPLTAAEGMAGAWREMAAAFTALAERAEYLAHELSPEPEPPTERDR